MEKSWVWEELHAARNIKNSFKHGIFTGLAYGGLYKFLNGKEPFDLRNQKKDSEATEKSENYKVILC
jgi:electron-transferring-flavoprotein dehydrogenase